MTRSPRWTAGATAGTLALALALAGCSSSGSATPSAPASTPAGGTSSAPASTPAAAPSSGGGGGAGVAAVFASGYSPCSTVDMAALGQAAGMTFVKKIVTADHGCLWSVKVGEGVQLSVHPQWNAAYLTGLKDAQTRLGRPAPTEVQAPGASEAVVVRAAIGNLELDNLYAVYPQGGVEVAVTGPASVATVDAAVAATGVIVG